MDSSNMFDLGWPELMLIMVVALVVIGPKELPNAIRTIMGVVRKLRSATREFQSGLNDIARESGLDDVKRDFEDIDYRDPAKTFGNLADSDRDILGLEDDPVEMNSILDDVNRAEPPTPPKSDTNQTNSDTPTEATDAEPASDEATLGKPKPSDEATS